MMLSKADFDELFPRAGRPKHQKSEVASPKKGVYGMPGLIHANLALAEMVFNAAYGSAKANLRRAAEKPRPAKA